LITKGNIPIAKIFELKSHTVSASIQFATLSYRQARIAVCRLAGWYIRLKQTHLSKYETKSYDRCR
jgi:antitoxin (DNA-binding transcriptional repressor) of toxin-antitoxin stability system